MDEAWKLLWAKSEPFHPLWKHLLDAAGVSLALPNPLEREGWPRETVALLVGLHDVGKADPTFQRMHQPYRPVLEAAGFSLVNDSGKRHERVSAHLVRQAVLFESANERLAESTAMAIAAHHGHWESGGHESGKCFETAKRILVELLKGLLGGPPLAPSNPVDLSAFGMRLAGHVVLCDWIASNEEFFKREELGAAEDPADYFEKSKRVALEMVRKLDLLPDNDPSDPGKIVEDPRPLQRGLLEARLAPGMVVIEAPMGEGKTEAAWILAEQWREAGYGGIYMALPTQATGEAIFERYDRDYLQKLGRSGRVHLIHGMAWLRDEKEPDEPFVTYGEREDAAFASQWFRPTRRAMLAAHGAGTVDQFLLAGLNARFGFLRLYGLDRRVLVVDEVHAYDAYMTAILARGLNWCRAMKIPVVLLSATLSAAQRQLLLEAYGAKGPDLPPDAPYPLVTHVPFEGQVSTLTPAATARRTLKLTACPGLLGDAPGTARLVETLAREGKCVCVIVNTVRQAQAVYQALTLRDEEKGLFHARFTANRRHEIAEEVIALFGKDRTNRPARFVLVATQVVEQSLDVDFDEMISEVAPIDLLLQRSGRLHRHQPRANLPELRVLLPDVDDFAFGGTEKVYDRYILLRSLAPISNGREVSLPDDFRRLIEGVYGDQSIPEGVVSEEDLALARNRWKEGIEEMETAAAPFLLQAPRVRLFRPVDEAFLDVEASSQFAHALSTHKVDHEFDYYTAVDDLERTADDTAGGGADMIGDTEFNSACYYKYFNVHVEGFIQNLTGEALTLDRKKAVTDADRKHAREVAAGAIRALVEAAVRVSPGAKQNSFAAFQLPSVVLVEIRPHNLPVSYANAFVKPVDPKRGDGVVSESAGRLVDEAQRLTAKFDLKASDRYLLLADDSLPNGGIETVASLGVLLDRVETAVSHG